MNNIFSPEGTFARKDFFECFFAKLGKINDFLWVKTKKRRKLVFFLKINTTVFHSFKRLL